MRHVRLFEAGWRFAACEIRRFDGRPRRWTLREGGAVVLRSGTSDIDIFVEVFGRGIYDPPPPVREALMRAPVRLVADVGAHVGLFALRALAAYPASRVVSLEPDPWNASVLLACRAASADAHRWSVRPAAAGTDKGRMPFLAVAGALSRQPVTAEATREPARRVDGVVAIDVETEDALPLICEADLVKIDIEGGEWPLLGDPRLARSRARAIALEYHPEHCPSADPSAKARELLEFAGYTVMAAGTNGSDVGQLWAWRSG
jgi:FkbM family methyltransferase